jgi:hypothetical protein
MKLVLKQSTGWFAAGWAFGEAMGLVSDAAFKLFVWVCLQADRQTGRLALSVPAVAQALGRTAEQVRGGLVRVGRARRVRLDGGRRDRGS